MVGEVLPAGSSLRDLGIHRLRDLSAPDRIFELRNGHRDDQEPRALRSLDMYPNNLPIQHTNEAGVLDHGTHAAIRATSLDQPCDWNGNDERDKNREHGSMGSRYG
jgi:hypothetical protein